MADKKTAATSRPSSSSSGSSGSSGSVSAKVLLDTYSWYEKHGDTSSPVNSASKGDTIKVSREEFDRGASMVPTALAKDKDAPVAGDAVELPRDLSEVKDADLRVMAEQFGHDVTDDTSRDELVAMVAAAPGHERPQV